MDVTPAGHGARGAAFVASTLAEFDLSDSGMAMLHEVARTLDRIDELERVVSDEGVTTRGSMGQTVVHPAVAEARQQRVILARLLRELDLEDDDAEDTPAVPSVNVERARHAAETRWSNVRRLRGAQ